MGACTGGAARAGPHGRGSSAETDGSHHRFAVSQDDGKRGQRGYDAGKKTKGRKRHIAVDAQGLLLAVVVHSAGIQDRVGARALMIRLFASLPNLKAVFADGGYTGALIGWVRAMFGWVLTVVKRTETHRFVVLPKRWIVERTFAWLNWSRRLSKDYEVRIDSSETMIKIAMAALLLKRLA